jgi:glyoxylase-like metal-dependent hydrolase (beta-lactamase superfamily II)
MRVVAISTGRLRMRPFFPPGSRRHGPETEVDPDGMVVGDVISLYAEAGAARILVDPNSWDQADVDGVLDLKAKYAGVEAALARAGVDRAEVTHVIVTHGHLDHFTGVVERRGSRSRPMYPNATVLAPRLDYEGRPKPGRDWFRSALEPAAAAGRLELYEGDRALGGGVTILATPGESRGHSVVRLESEGVRLFYLGDLFHVTAEFAHLGLSPVTGDADRQPEVVPRSRRRVLVDEGGAGAVLLFTHARFPGFGVLEPRGPESWTWRPAPRAARRPMRAAEVCALPPRDR